LACQFVKVLMADYFLIVGEIDKCAFAPSDGLVAILAIAEDRRFHYHVGVDPISVVRACFMTFLRGKLQGASTVEAQLVRTLTGRREISATRKLRESLLAILISLSRSKRAIAAAYLNCAYFGPSMIGVHRAALACGWSITSCSLQDACTLIAMIRRPVDSSLSGKNQEKLRKRAAWIRTRVAARYQGGTLSLQKESG